MENERVQVSGIFVDSDTQLHVRISFDASQWTALTSILLEISTPQGGNLITKKLVQTDSKGSSIQVRTPSKGFYTIFVTSTNTPAGNKAPAFKVAASYTAPQVL